MAVVLRPLLAEAARTWRCGGAVQFGILAGAALMSVGLLHGVAFLAAGGPWLGPLAWRKPFAFGLSFGLTTLTVAWIVSRIRLGERPRWLLLGPLAAATTIEVAWVSVQRARGVPSHFNLTTPADELAFAVAGGGAIAVTVAILVAVTVLVWWRPDAPRALTSAIRSGLAILLVSQAVGAVMIQRGFASVVSGGQPTHAVAPAGDLKVVHAVAMHGVQVLPVVALLLLAAPLSHRAALAAVRAAAVGYAGVTAGTLVLAVSGRPVTDPTAASIVVTTVVLGAAAAVLAPAVRERLRTS